MPPSAPDSSRIHLRIRRQDGPDAPPYWELFSVDQKPNMNVISCLQAIAADPVTIEGRQVPPVVWDSNCLEEVCGACTMVMNGRVGQSCSTLVDQLLAGGTGTPGRPIVLEPMSKFPVVRDLWVDRQRMFSALLKLKAWVPIDGTHDLGPGPTEQPEQQGLRYALSRCMTCGCCLEACPQFLRDNDFIGAQAIAQGLLFNEHATGRRLGAHRLETLSSPGGVTDCGNAQNCVKVCPKDVPLTEAIARIGRQTTVHAVKKFFSGT